MEPPPLTSSSLPDSRWALAQRVADSSCFRRCAKLRAFLLYVCENTLLGRLENVREQRIGSKVFGRSPSYSLSEDNIVRVEARELRKRLETYFAEVGRDEPVVIEIPRGTYVPVFKAREQAIPAAVEPKDQEPCDAAALGEANGRHGRWLAPLLAAGLVITTGVAVWAIAENWRLRRQSPGVRSGAGSAEYSFYPELLGSLGTPPGRETLLVVSNPRVSVYYGADSMAPAEQAPGRTILAPKELKKTFGFALMSSHRDLPYHFLSLSSDEFTGLGEAVGAFHLGRLMQLLRRPLRPTQQRFVNWGQVQKQDLIILGGPQANDWTYQADTKSEFNFLPAYIENARPLPGEQKRYPASSDPALDVTDYGVIKMLTSPYGFRMLLLAGRTSAGTAGVAGFFSDPAKMRVVYDRIRAAARSKSFPSNWEVLIRIAVRDKLPLEASVIALRPAPPGRP